MTTFIALLRAINVGGTSLLPMKELAALCTELGFEDVRTYIQTGNVILKSDLPKQEIRLMLERALADKMGKPVDVIVRTAGELQSALDRNPFRDGHPSHVAVMFLTRPAPESLLDTLVIPGSEQLALADEEIYIHYPDGMGRSKLRIPSSVVGTVRNINTVAKLVGLTAA